jgi:hypothetical protein
VLVASAGGTSPLSDRALPFLTAMAAPFCSSSPDAIQAFLADSVGKGSSPNPYPFEDGSCRLSFVTQDISGRAFRIVTAFSLPAGLLPSVLPTAPVASLAPRASLPPGPVSGTTGGGASGPGAFASSVPAPTEVSLEIGPLVQSALLALVFVLLMPFPATLFNSTLEEHYEEVRGWFPRLRTPFRLPGGGGSFWSSPIGVGTFVVISAVVYGFLNPGIGLTGESAAEVAGIGLGIVVTAFAFELPVLLAHRGSGVTLRVLPGTIVVGLLCVVISRLTGFLPGYVYGLILGFAFAGELSRAQEGRRAAMAGVVMLALAVGAWLLTGVVGGDDQSVVGIALRTVLAAVVVGGLEGVVFGLLPLRMLRGETLFTWNRVVWGVIFGLGVFAFAHILINPTSGYLADSSRTPFLTILTLLIGFGAVSIGFWAYFRYRPERPAADPEEPGGR